jgi:hypothetical protein
MTEVQLVGKANTGITNADIQRLASLKQLKELAIVGEPFDESALAHLADLPQLTALRLGGPQLTESAIPQFAKLKNLISLDIGETLIVSTKELSKLNELPQLAVADRAAGHAGGQHPAVEAVATESERATQALVAVPGKR